MLHYASLILYITEQVNQHTKSKTACHDAQPVGGNKKVLTYFIHTDVPELSSD